MVSLEVLTPGIDTGKAQEEPLAKSYPPKIKWAESQKAVTFLGYRPIRS
jgi:hypothetical protein